MNLSGLQQTAILNAARPLAPAERTAFMAGLAKQLVGRSEIGDGELHRAIRDLQRQYFRPPKDTAWV
jgi:hypothetical protein